MTTQRDALFVRMTPEQQETIRTALALLGSITTLGLVGAIYSIFRTY